MEELLDLLKTPAIQGGGGAGGLLLFIQYIWRPFMMYLNGNNKVEEREADARIVEANLLQRAMEPIKHVSDALVSVVNNSEGLTLAITALVDKVNDFRLDSVNQHTKTRDELEIRLIKQDDTLSKAFALFSKTQQEIAETLKDLRDDKDHRQNIVSDIFKTKEIIEQTHADVAKVVMMNENNEHAILDALRLLTEKIEGLDMKLDTLTIDMKADIQTAKQDIETIKEKVTHEIKQVEKEVTNERERGSNNQPDSGNTNPPTT